MLCSELRSRIRRLGEGEREEEEEGEEGEGEEEGDRGLDGPGLDLRALFQGASMSSTSSEGTSFDDSLPSPTELFEGSEVTENVDTGSGECTSHPHLSTSSHPHIFTPSHLHTLTPSHHHTVTPPQELCFLVSRLP